MKKLFNEARQELKTTYNTQTTAKKKSIQYKTSQCTVSVSFKAAGLEVKNSLHMYLYICS